MIVAKKVANYDHYFLTLFLASVQQDFPSATERFHRLNQAGHAREIVLATFPSECVLSS